MTHFPLHPSSMIHVKAVTQQFLFLRAVTKNPPDIERLFNLRPQPPSRGQFCKWNVRWSASNSLFGKYLVLFVHACYLNGNGKMFRMPKSGMIIYQGGLGGKAEYTPRPNKHQGRITFLF